MEDIIIARLHETSLSSSSNSNIPEQQLPIQPTAHHDANACSSQENTLPLLQLIGPALIRYPSSRVRSIRGYRVRQILGLMVANQVLRTKLSADEFRELAADSVRDTESSANITRVNLTRIRSMLGKHTLIVESELAPRLNMEKIVVDLIRVFQQLDEIVNNINRRHVQRVFQDSCEVLSTLQEQTVYANMYGDFFDMARADFEIRVRKVLLMAAEFLRRQEEGEQSLRILRECFQIMIGDEEVEEALKRTLVETGHSVEAVYLAKVNKD